MFSMPGAPSTTEPSAGPRGRSTETGQTTSPSSRRRSCTCSPETLGWTRRGAGLSDVLHVSMLLPANRIVVGDDSRPDEAGFRQHASGSVVAQRHERALLDDTSPL